MNESRHWFPAVRGPDAFPIRRVRLSLTAAAYATYAVISQSAGRPPLDAEESPGSKRMRRRITSGGGDPRESATESKPPDRGLQSPKHGKGERVR